MELHPVFIPVPQTGLIPICDLEGRRYRGLSGGLYPGGSNRMPATHHRRGLEAARSVKPLDPQGYPDPGGRIVFLAAGMSNTGLYFGSLCDRMRESGLLDPRVTLVNAALEGKDILSATDPDDAYWHYVDMRLRQSGVHAGQVQAIWFMQARHGSGLTEGQGMAHIPWLCNHYVRAIGLLAARFPRLRQVFSSSREYGGYNPPGQGNPEPYAYYTGWAWKHLVSRQIRGSLSRETGPVPWLAWSGYFCADGLKPRKDGLCWLPEDFEADGVHPSPAGRAKAADILWGFFRHAPETAWLWSQG